jgi:hypothetical protein
MGRLTLANRVLLLAAVICIGSGFVLQE